MKNIPIKISILMLFVAIVISPRITHASGDVRMGSNHGYYNQIVEIPITASSFSSPIAGVTINGVIFDSTKLQYSTTTPVTISGVNFNANLVGNNQININWYDTPVNLASNRVLAIMKFKVITNKPISTNLTFGNNVPENYTVEMSDGMGDAVQCTFTGISILLNRDLAVAIATSSIAPILTGMPIVQNPVVPDTVPVSVPVVAPDVNTNSPALFVPTYTPYYTPTNLNHTVPSKFIPTYPPTNFAPKVAPIIYAPKAISLVNSAFSVGTFEKDLQLGSNDPDVVRLQKYLNFNKYFIAESGPGSVGNESTYFGQSTYQALKRFQAENGIPSTGYFGPVTRKLFSK